MTKSLFLGGNEDDGYYFTLKGAERIYWLGSQYVDCNPGCVCWSLRYVNNCGIVSNIGLGGFYDKRIKNEFKGSRNFDSVKEKILKIIS